MLPSTASLWTQSVCNSCEAPGALRWVAPSTLVIAFGISLKDMNPSCSSVVVSASHDCTIARSIACDAASQMQCLCLKSVCLLSASRSLDKTSWCQWRWYLTCVNVLRPMWLYIGLHVALGYFPFLLSISVPVAAAQTDMGRSGFNTPKMLANSLLADGCPEPTAATRNISESLQGVGVRRSLRVRNMADNTNPRVVSAYFAKELVSTKGRRRKSGARQSVVTAKKKAGRRKMNVSCYFLKSSTSWKRPRAL